MPCAPEPAEIIQTANPRLAYLFHPFFPWKVSSAPDFLPASAGDPGAAPCSPFLLGSVSVTSSDLHWQLFPEKFFLYLIF